MSFSSGEMQYRTAFLSATSSSFMRASNSSNDLMDILKKLKNLGPNCLNLGYKIMYWLSVSLCDKIGWTQYLRLLSRRFSRRYRITVKTVSTSIFNKCKNCTEYHDGRGNARSTPDKRVSCKHYTKILRALIAR